MKWCGRRTGMGHYGHITCIRNSRRSPCSNLSCRHPDDGSVRRAGRPLSRRQAILWKWHSYQIIFTGKILFISMGKPPAIATYSYPACYPWRCDGRPIAVRKVPDRKVMGGRSQGEKAPFVRGICNMLVFSALCQEPASASKYVENGKLWKMAISPSWREFCRLGLRSKAGGGWICT